MKKPMIISVVCAALAILLLYLSFRPAEAPAPAATEVFGLVIQSDTGTFVMQLQKGMQQAADELGVRLNVCGPQETEQLADAAGVALWLDDPSATAQKLKSMGLPVVMVGSGLRNFVSVQGDDDNAGTQLIRYALSQSSPDKVVLLLDDEDAHAATRGRSAMTWARAREARILDYQPGMELPKGCEIVVAASLRATKDMAERKKNGRFDGRVMGADTGDSRVADLENGLVSAMVLDSPYAMGYLALYRLKALATEGAADSALTSVLLATPENMYLAENVKQVFPLLQ